MDDLLSQLFLFHYSRDEYREAIEYAERRLTNAKSVGDKKEEAIANGNLGIAYEMLSEYQMAIEYLNESLTIAEEIEDKEEKLRAYGNLGKTYCSKGDFQTAITYLNNSIDIAKDIGDKRIEGFCYRSLGNTYNQKGEFNKSIEYHQKSLGIAQEMGDKEEQGNAYGNLGVNHRSLGEYHTAIEFHTKSLGIAIEMKNKHSEANGYGNLASCYSSLAEFRKAIELHEKSLSITKSIGNRAGEAMACGNLGSVYELLGEYHEAYACHEESLKIAKEIGDKKREENAYGNIANIYDLTGNYSKAIEYNNKKLAIAENIGDREGEGIASANLGSAYQALGRYEEAIKHLEKSRSIFHEIGDKEAEGSCYGGIGNVHQALGNHEMSFECYEKELKIADQIGSEQKKGHVYGNLGIVYSSLGDFERSLEYQNMSLKIALEIGDRRKEGLVHRNIGSLYYRSDCGFKDLSKAEEHFQKSVECYEQLFDDLKEKDQLKISFVDTYAITIKYLTEIRVQTGKPEEALLVCERGRARALRDILSVKYKTTEMPVSKQKLLKHDDLKTLSASNESCILFYDLHRNNMATRLWVIAPESNPLYIQNEAVETEIFDDEVIKKYLHYLVKKSFEDMNVRDQGLICEDRSQGPLKCEVVDPISAATFPQLLRNTIGVEDEFNDKPPLEMLFDSLVSPVLDVVTQDEIVVIPDGPLFTVPFAALEVPNTGKFLSEIKRIRLAPSLTTLKILQESSDDHFYKSGALIIGDPFVGEVMYKGKNRKDIHPLPGARDEALQIGELLEVQPLIGKQATKEEVLSKLQEGVSVIHFAAHGSAESGEIFLAPSQPTTKSTIPEEKDYMLTMKEVQDSGIRAQLVVLSCCHSGRGEIKSEGIVGMTRAFLAAGARAVVASLWAIADQATRFFMVKFYSHLKKGESAGRSLQQAMKEMRETEMYKEPKYWAAFFLIGDDVTITM